MTQTTKRSPMEDIRDLKALREELRLQAHLFKADAKDTFEVLEKRWREAQKIVQSLEEKSSATVAELLQQYRLLKGEIAPGKRSG